MLRSISRLTITAITLGALAQQLHAQSAPVLAKGSHVRVMIPADGRQREQRIEGDLLRLDGRTAVLSTGTGVRSRTVTYLLDDLAGPRLEQPVVNRSNRGAGILLGILAGGTAGVLIGKSVECTGFLCEAEGAGVGGIFGAIIGAALGADLGTSRRWQPVFPQAVGISITPHMLGVGVAF